MIVRLLPGTQCTGASLTDLADLLRDQLGVRTETLETGAAAEQAMARPAGAADTPQMSPATAAETAAAVAGEHPVLLVGHSLGGTVALSAARLHPERVAGLVLVTTNPFAPRADQRLAWDEAEAAARTHGPEAVARALLPALVGHHGDGGHLANAVLEMAREVGLQRFLAQLALQRERVDERPGLGRCPVPVLSIGAAHDELVRPEAAAAAAAAPRGSHVVLPTGHLAPLEDPAGVAAAILAWWREHDLTRPDRARPDDPSPTERVA